MNVTPYNDNEILIDERRAILLEILEYIDNLCKKNDIIYYIAYGSLIGVVRHKGFIPWDDDIDIWVPIHEYEHLLCLIEAEKKYTVLNNISNKNYSLHFAKICDKRTLLIDERPSNFTYKGSVQRGIAIDIFLLFDIDDKKIEELDKIVQKRNRFFRFEHDVYRGTKKIILYIMELFGENEEKYRSQIYHKELENISGDEIGCSISPYGKKDRYKKTWFSGIERLEFESIKVNVPCGYKEILTTLYGDYMTLPSEEDRKVLTHNVKAVYID